MSRIAALHSGIRHGGGMNAICSMEE